MILHRYILLCNKPMPNKILLDTHFMVTHDLPEPLLCRAYFFHDIRITCHTNHPAILTISDEMFRIFPERSEPRGEATYYIFCYENASQFPEQVPQNPIHIETIRLLTRTKLTF